MSLKIQKTEVLEKTRIYIQSYFENEGSGHDWWHIFRVWKLALKIAEKEGGDIFTIEMAALLHDLDDWKLDNNANEFRSKKWLQKTGLSETVTSKIVEIVEQVSFKGAGVENKAISLEAKIVQDADRLDAIGAIGIARTFAYGGNKGRLIYHPEVKSEIHKSFEEYKKNTGPTINHFYEKLLLIKDLLNTITARKMAEIRHQFMEEYLNQFFNEWDCNI